MLLEDGVCYDQFALLAKLLLAFAGNLSFFKIHVNHFMARDKCQCYLKIHVVGKGPGASLNFRISPFSN